MFFVCSFSGKGWSGGRGVTPHSEHRFPAPSSKEGCRKPVFGVWCNPWVPGTYTPQRMRVSLSLSIQKKENKSWLVSSGLLTSRPATTQGRLRTNEAEEANKAEEAEEEESQERNATSLHNNYSLFAGKCYARPIPSRTQSNKPLPLPSVSRLAFWSFPDIIKEKSRLIS